VDGDKYSIDYAIRASLELGGKDSNLCLHYGLRNRKGCNADEGSKTLLDKKFKIHICACEENKEQANSRKARRIELKDVDVWVALKAPPSKDCSRFLNGICLLNKKGKKCSSNHNIKDAWVTSPEGNICCTIECALKPHSSAPSSPTQCFKDTACSARSASTNTPRSALLSIPLILIFAYSRTLFLFLPQVGVVRCSSKRDPVTDQGL
jgi:hypothetical protein